MFPRRLLPWLLALTLLFGQASAFAHAVSHLNAHDSALPDKVCEVCVAQASLGSGAPAILFRQPIEAAGKTDLPAAAQPSAAVSPPCAHARAPPAAV